MEIRILEIEEQLYFKDTVSKIKSYLIGSNDYKIWMFQKNLRKSEIYRDRWLKNRKNILNCLLYLYYRRSKNVLGRKLGFDVPEGVFGEGLRIYHIGSIVVNSAAHVGKNCKIVGNCCIGNVNGLNIAPDIGDNCMIGWGATLIGDIKVANNCSIGAGAVVTKDILELNAVVLGIPGVDKTTRFK